MAFDWKSYLPAAGSVVGGLFGGGGHDFINPAHAARPYLDKIPETLSPYFNPYIERGNRAGDFLEGQYGQMARDPAGFLASMSQGYQQSPGYQYRLNEALHGANNAAAAGGMLGSPANQAGNEQVAEGLANQDYEQWLNHVFDLFGQGHSGYQNFFNKGYGASTNYGEDLARALESQASLAYQGANARNKYNEEQDKENADMWGSIGGLAGNALAAFI